MLVVAEGGDARRERDSERLHGSEACGGVLDPITTTQPNHQTGQLADAPHSLRRMSPNAVDQGAKVGHSAQDRMEV